MEEVVLALPEDLPEVFVVHGPSKAHTATKAFRNPHAKERVF